MKKLIILATLISSMSAMSSVELLGTQSEVLEGKTYNVSYYRVTSNLVSNDICEELSADRARALTYSIDAFMDQDIKNISAQSIDGMTEAMGITDVLSKGRIGCAKYKIVSSIKK